MVDEPPVDDRPFLPGQLLFPWESDDAPAAPKQSPPQSDSVSTATEPEPKLEPELVGEGLDAPQPPAGSDSPAGDDSAAESDATAERSKPVKKKPNKASSQTDVSQTAESAKAESTSPPPAAKVKATSKRRATKRRPKKAAKRRRASAKSTRPSPNNSQQPLKSYHDAMEYIPLKWGAQLPKVGFGFWKVDKDQTADVCRSVIEVGYRHLDCACDYGNEVEVGQGIKAAISDGLCDREDLWVTSKLWNTYHAPEHVHQACQRSLDDLGLDYLDLYLIHFPIAQRFVPFEKNYPPGWFFDPDATNPVVEEARVPMHETWQAMEELATSGLVRNIGICNFGTSQIRDLLSYARIRPAVLQVETHPYLTQEKLLRYCDQEKIAYTAFSPLGAQSYFSLGMADSSEAVMESDVVRNIATACGKSPAQVLLRWGVQRGTAVIPKTSKRERMEENINVFDFELTDEQMTAISGLNQGRRFNDPGDFGEAAFNTFLPIYE
ncbi:2,5-diketo-D-gluconic acid reductase A [Fuerstiella marisgermanici]|uniref:2,5-diketo-D-gluconic acid reductase A n=2 Tax=Fuerstiella marisgermanici TaxID=1891926 RepID=A0A1P8WND2_9PLAN|nr:2,5-diketo-D-gluconic acid reductase A [Fuerstiella marisgermanici]